MQAGYGSDFLSVNATSLFGFSVAGAPAIRGSSSATRIAIVFSNDNSAANNYQFTDKSPFPGVNYYRLNMVDKDQTQEYSQLISFRLGANGNIAISPNPELATFVYSSTV